MSNDFKKPNVMCKKDVLKCWEFSKEIIKKENQFNRLNEPEIIRQFRTSLGKLGELFIDKYSHALKEGTLNNYSYDEGMFEIFEGSSTVDDSDFTLNNQSVDIKTIYAANHKNIVIPIDQPAKDVYFAVKIINKYNFNSNDFLSNCLNHEANIKKFLNGLAGVECIGYISRENVEKAPIKNYGNNAYFVPLSSLNTHKLDVELFEIKRAVQKNSKILRP